MSRLMVDGMWFQVMKGTTPEHKDGYVIHSLAFTGPRGSEFVRKVREDELLDDARDHCIEGPYGRRDQVRFIGPYMFDEGCVQCRLIFRSPY